MGILAGAGLASLLDFPYTTINGLLPFLCLGIGIDDMFVIVQCYYNNPNNDDDNLHEAIGKAAMRAGAAITVTSITDIIAFMAGAVTSMPGLRAFCMYCALSVLCIYLLQLSWFLAWFSIGERLQRINNRISLVNEECKNKSEKVYSDSSLLTILMGWLGDKISGSVMFKLFVLLTTFQMACVGLYGAYNMESGLKFQLFLHQDSHLVKLVELVEHLTTSDEGTDTEIFLGVGEGSDVERLFEEVDGLVSKLEEWVENRYYLKEVNSWWGPFKQFMEEEINGSNNNTTDKNKMRTLSDFLHSPQGFQYLPDIVFESELECGKSAPNIKCMKIHVKYANFLPWSSGTEKNVAKKALETLIEQNVKSGEAFTFTKFYVSWEIDDVMSFELARNMSLAAIGVFMVTLVLLGDFLVTTVVLSSVSLAILDTIGILHLWGVTLNLVSCLDLVMCVGIGVDYSAHVALAILHSDKSDDEENRLRHSLTAIGPAVLNGGATTFLAAAFVAFAKTEAFVIYFKVFSLIVCFGLFHALLLLPLALHLILSSRHRKIKSLVK